MMNRWFRWFNASLTLMKSTTPFNCWVLINEIKQNWTFLKSTHLSFVTFPNSNSSFIMNLLQMRSEKEIKEKDCSVQILRPLAERWFSLRNHHFSSQWWFAAARSPANLPSVYLFKSTLLIIAVFKCIILIFHMMLLLRLDKSRSL